MPRNDYARFSTAMSALAAGASLLIAPTALSAASGGACPEAERTVRLGFYAHFEPVSHSAEGDPGAPGFDRHLGYEADLLTALEAMEGVNLTFVRRGIDPWTDIWLRPAGPDYDMVGGGITVRDSRTRDATGKQAVVCTDGHIHFRQSLLVRAEDAERLARYENLDSAVRVGALAATTGETRLLELTGLVDANGVLPAGVRIETPRGEIVADGGDGFRIAAGGASPALEDRRHLHPASSAMPQVIYMAEEDALIAALLDRKIDAFARGEIGNRYAARAHGGALAVGALDESVETGGFAAPVGDAALVACLNEAIDWLTDSRRIGYPDWIDDPSVFLQRARMWQGGKR